MKKVILFVAAALCLSFASCNNTSKKEVSQNGPDPKMEQKCDKHQGPGFECQMTEEEKAEMKAFKEKWDSWDKLAEADKKALVAEVKAKIDKKEAEMEAKKAEMEKQKAEMDAKWNNFNNLTLEEQKTVLDMKLKSCCKNHMQNGCTQERPQCSQGHQHKSCPDKK